MDPRVIAIAAIAAGLWYAGDKTVHGVKALDRKIATKFHRHPKPTAPQGQKVEPK